MTGGLTDDNAGYTDTGVLEPEHAKYTIQTHGAKEHTYANRTC
jgi:hypothetical protein